MNWPALIGSLVLVLLVVTVMTFVRATGARREKSLLHEMRFSVPPGYSEFHRRSDGVLLSKEQPRQVSLELRTASVPEDVPFLTHLESFLAASSLPFDGLTETNDPPVPAGSNWSGRRASRTSAPYIRNLATLGHSCCVSPAPRTETARLRMPHSW